MTAAHPVAADPALRPRRTLLRSSSVLAGVLVAATLAMTGCLPPTAPGGGGGGGGTPTTPVPGPAADLSQQLTGGNGVVLGSAVPVDLQQAGYVQQEYVAAGTATAYKSAGTLSQDGRWTFQTDGTAPYRTRALVRRPADPAKFSGTVVLEWLNVSGGIDADPDWASTHEEITRKGDVWVGLTTQRIGVNGGQVLLSVPGPGSELVGKGLKAIDPARYGTLDHPGDGFSFDMFTQVARGLRDGAALGGLHPQRVIAAGESQSAFAMVTYYNGVQPLTRAFDGFLVHSRGASALPLVKAGQSADMTGSILGNPTTFRTDVAAPVLDIQTESDVVAPLSSAKAHQPDNDHFRLWEVAGTSHVDQHLFDGHASAVDCGAPINNGPAHLVVKAALRALDTWVMTGQAPVSAPRFTMNSDAISRDADGIALGGIRTPLVDVPVDVVSGVPGPDSKSLVCVLLGSTKPLPASRLTALYPNRAAYQQRYDASAQTAIDAGFVLADDRAALEAYAQPQRINP